MITVVPKQKKLGLYHELGQRLPNELHLQLALQTKKKHQQGIVTLKDYFSDRENFYLVRHQMMTGNLHNFMARAKMNSLNEDELVAPYLQVT